MHLQDNKNSWADIQVQEGVLQIRRWQADTRHDHFLGVDEQGRYLYLLRIPLSKNVLTLLPTISGCASSLLQIDAEVYFCLTLKKNEEWGIFKLLTQVLISNLEKEYHASVNFIFSQLKATLKRCSNFFRKEVEHFGRVQAIGLLGELVFLQRYVIPLVGWENALSSWKGPTGAPQDFCVLDTTVEIKSTESASKQSIHISNAEQLATGFSRGYLCVVGLSSGCDLSGDTLTLNSMVQKLKQDFECESGGAEIFLALLDMVGYDASSSESEKNYKILGIDFYELREGFPRILPNMLPFGIYNIQYTIDLNMCESFKQLPHWLQK